MRFMDIPPFPRRIGIPDFDSFLRGRLSQQVVLWPQQAIPLMGYMGWPNDSAGRAEATRILRGWERGAEIPLPDLRRIQTDWRRVADILSLHYDLAAGEHLVKRGGSSIGKSIALANANSASRGAGIANLWKCWKFYKDVAHLVTAAAIICSHVTAHVQARPLETDFDWFKVRPFGEFGLEAGQIQPFTIAMMMPDFVIAAALSWQIYGLSYISGSRGQPIFNPATTWRIPRNINAIPIARPKRKIRPQDVQVLKERRAGNRGRANRHETTPVLD